VTLFGSKDDKSDDVEEFPSELVRSLDLYPIFSDIAAHTGTKRGYNAIMRYVGRKDTAVPTNPFHSSPVHAKRRRVSRSDYTILGQRSRAHSSVSIAQSVQEAKELYDLTEEAILALNCDNGLNLTHPSIYGDDSGPFDTKTIPLTDYDDWLLFSSTEEWTLEHILQAEKVIETLLNAHRWAEQSQTWMPRLAAIGLQINALALEPVWEEIHGSVKVVRVRSITDPTGRNSYTFQINRDKFPVMGILEDKLSEYRSIGVSEAKIIDLTAEIDAREDEIKNGFVRIMCSELQAIDEGLEKVAKIDSCFAKAAYSVMSGGQIPSMDLNGCIDVKQFRHPLLLQRMVHDRMVVPIDLQMNDNKRILIIGGPNGGGKTLAAKAFGIVSAFSKAGVPIPMSPHVHDRPRVDFFDVLHVSIGDGQDLENGQSTFTAQLSTYSGILNSVLSESSLSQPSSHLIIMDELGAGTEANAGGAIAEAILDKLSAITSCRVIATTHSTRLKSLSFENEMYECAAVLLKPNAEQGSKFSLPAFQLQYGIIGESYALGAANRCSPPLPMDVLQRAENLLAQNSDSAQNASTYHALNTSLQKQIQLAEEARAQAELYREDMERIRRAMLSLASSYDEHFQRLESRLNSCYWELNKAQNGSPLEIVGETITQIRVVRKQVKTEKERLKERGIKILPNDYNPVDGEMVVIIQEGDLDGMQASVVSSSDIVSSPDEIAVMPSFVGDFASASANGIDVARPLVLKRHEIGVWDYDSVWEQNDDVADTKSVPDSRRRLAVILSRVKGRPSELSPVKSGGTSSSFSSSRERKAAKKAGGGKKR
jgi:DNA mismatch repair protein MutS2